jgi:predicted transglutaminase-like cysteine proteinase
LKFLTSLLPAREPARVAAATTAVIAARRLKLPLLCALVLIPFWLQGAQPMVTDDMLLRLESDYSAAAGERGRAVNQLIEQLAGKPVELQLQEVNRFYNQFQYREDTSQWGQKDYWATPEEFIGTRQGDCEDYVIAKYFTLRKLGVPDERLYLTYAKHLQLNVAHMVLSYFPTQSSAPLILDNYNGEIVEGSKRKDLLPVYSFNAKSLFLSNASAGLGKSLPTDKIKNSKWQKLLGDMRNNPP